MRRGTEMGCGKKKQEEKVDKKQRKRFVKLGEDESISGYQSTK